MAHRAARLCEELAARGITVPTPGDIPAEAVAAQVEEDRAWLEHLQSACIQAGIDSLAPAPRTRDATLGGDSPAPESDVLGEVRRIAERLEEVHQEVKNLRARGRLEAEVDETRDRIDELRAREIVLMLEAIAVTVGVNLRLASWPASELVLALLHETAKPLRPVEIGRRLSARGYRMAPQTVQSALSHLKGEGRVIFDPESHTWAAPATNSTGPLH